MSSLSIDEINRLKEENEKLNEIIAELKAYKDVNEDFKTAWEELKAENERLKEEIKNNKSAYQVELGTYNMECGNLLEENKQLLQTLQEIKKYIAKICKEECGYVQKKRCLDCDCRFGAILDLITKAEEE